MFRAVSAYPLAILLVATPAVSERSGDEMAPTQDGRVVTAMAFNCRDAISNYNDNLDIHLNYIKKYASCIADSRGEDDCSSEFRRLKNAQSDFEMTVSDIAGYC